MIEPLRSAFNATWTERAYEVYKDRLAESAGSKIGFRVCESPVFLPPDLRDAMVQGALEIWDLLLQPAALERSKAAVPPEFDVPASDDHPLFAQADFAIVEADGRLAPRLIELQGFPSLYAFQLLQGRLCLEMVPGHGEPLEFLIGGLDDVGYRRVVGDAILGGLPAENVVLLDLDPPGQGTYPDFAATEKLFGIRAVCPTDLDEERARAVVRAGREEDPHPPRLQPPDRGRDRREEGPSALPLHGGAGRAVGGPPELVLPLEQARPAGAEAPPRARGPPPERLRPRP